MRCKEERRRGRKEKYEDKGRVARGFQKDEVVSVRGTSGSWGVVLAAVEERRRQCKVEV